MKAGATRMFREKLVTTLLWSLIPVSGAMVADYEITIRLLHNYQAYTPLVTLAISVIVSLPVAYVMVSGRIDLREARDELARARDTAVSANEAKSKFFANVSHELRTPLNAIIGFSELLASEGFQDRRMEYAKLIHSSGVHLLGLVNDLLDLARIEAGRFELHDQAVDLEELIGECLALTKEQAAGHRIVRSIEPGQPLVYGDRRALKQILLNLLTNAIKFTPSGGTVETFVRRESSGDMTFGVKDDGVGIAEEDLGRVFERFGQGRHDLSGEQEGTGLGLPIVKGLAEAHGGAVAIESRRGHGTCVSVRLPRKRMMPRANIALAS